MTGPEHYKKAEEYLDGVANAESIELTLRRDLVLAAQVHATLALTAATANRDDRPEAGGPLANEPGTPWSHPAPLGWDDVLRVKVTA